jgi:Holliday junction resolvase
MGYRVTKARTDRNQTEIVNSLRKAGCSVLSLTAVGDGCPDLLVGFNGVNYLFEVKDGKKTPSKRKLTKQQLKFFGTWRGSRHVVYSVNDALSILNLDSYPID